MYKDKALQKEKTAERQRRYRNKQKGVTLEGVTGKGVTDYPAIIVALADPVKRKKLERITLSLKKHNVSEKVNYGISGPDFSMIGNMLDVLK